MLDGVDGGAPEVSVCAEVVVQAGHDFYDFEAKYIGGSDLVVPADLPADVQEQVRLLAAVAYDALGCEGLARADFFVLPDGSVLLNELNTMPGFTPTSMFPLLWAAQGVDYPELVDRLLKAAVERPLGLR